MVNCSELKIATTPLRADYSHFFCINCIEKYEAFDSFDIYGEHMQAFVILKSNFTKSSFTILFSSIVVVLLPF